MQNGIPGSNNPDYASGSDDQVRAYHEQALARGDKQILFRTAEGRLHSYTREELTVAGAAGVLYAARMAGVAAKAKRLRAERGIPEPTARQFDR